MNSKNYGLTVGELSIAIAALIVVVMVWSSFNKEKNDKVLSLNYNSTSSEVITNT